MDIGDDKIARDCGVSDSGERGVSWTSGVTLYHIMERVSTEELGVTSELWVGSSSYLKISSLRSLKNSSASLTSALVTVVSSSSRSWAKISDGVANWSLILPEIRDLVLRSIAIGCIGPLGRW